MFVSDNLVFVELHKTGGSHIGKMLEKVVKGEHIGKHNQIPDTLLDRYILGSIRNPWDWYVSLWAFGCGDQGSVRHQVKRRVSFSYYWRQLNKEMGQTWLHPNYYWQQWLADIRKPVDQWKSVYLDSESPSHFRSWLKLMLDFDRRFDIGEGFGFSPISKHSGLLTYRYFKLFTNLGSNLYNRDIGQRKNDLDDLWEKTSVTDFIIRNENLEEDLISAIKQAQINLSEDEISFIVAAKNNKTNTSKRKPYAYYYDQESIDLISDRESFIIKKHKYQPPNIKHI